MREMRLILKLHMQADPELLVKVAARITVDGAGSLVVHSVYGTEERIDLSAVRALGIQSIRIPSRPALEKQAA